MYVLQISFDFLMFEIISINSHSLGEQTFLMLFSISSGLESEPLVSQVLSSFGLDRLRIVLDSSFAIIMALTQVQALGIRCGDAFLNISICLEFIYPTFCMVIYKINHRHIAYFGFVRYLFVNGKYYDSNLEILLQITD